MKIGDRICNWTYLANDGIEWDHWVKLLAFQLKWLASWNSLSIRWNVRWVCWEAADAEIDSKLFRRDSQKTTENDPDDQKS